jgi:hypothetical protein
MKIVILAVLTLVLCCGARARQETSEQLAAVLEDSVRLAAQGDVAGAVRKMAAESSKPRDLKQINSQIDGFKQMYSKLSPLGELDSVERLSLVFAGESFFRLRVVEKRTDGVVLWTFIGYRLKAGWYYAGLNTSGTSDLLEGMRQYLDPADIKSKLESN